MTPDDDTTPPATPPRLAEGDDYTVEDGRWVFTAGFLRRRGYCCRSGCRHCPYGHPTPPEKVGDGPADDR